MFFTWIQAPYTLRKKHWDKLNKAGYIGEELGHGKMFMEKVVYIKFCFKCRK